MHIQGAIIGFIPTRDAEAARRFYEGALGMRFIEDDRFAVVLQAGDNTLRIVRASSFTPQPFTILGWEVDDIASAVARLVAAGVTMEHFGLPGQGTDGIWNTPGGAARVAWFKDPDGNVLSLSQHS